MKRPRFVVGRIRFDAKRAVLERSWSQPFGSADRAGAWIGGQLARLHWISRWAGYTVRFVPGPPGRLLDVGCGNGAHLVFMRELGWDVEGIEPDPVAADLARAAGLTVREQTLEQASLEEARYDAITMSHVLEHLADPVSALRQLARALRSGGRLVSIAPNPVSSLARRYGPAWRGLEPPLHRFLLSPAATSRAAALAGLVPEVWTTARNAGWMAAESESIRRYGSTRRVVARPWLGGLRPRLEWSFRPGSGEEVVLVAVKP